LSTQLKKKLERIVEEDCRREGTKISTELPKYKDALLKIKQRGKLDLLISVEGTKQINAENDAKILEKLERANLIKGEDKFTHRNNYRQYELTAEGTELLKQLESEP
jgi:predicted transcriptional regulator